MRRTLAIALPLAVATSFVALAALPRSELSTCVARAPEATGQVTGYELVDIFRGQAWVTQDWTVEAYTETSLGLRGLTWYKNQPRIGSAAQTRMLRSPACSNDGEFTYQTAFDRSFFLAADSVRFVRMHGPTLTEAVVRKYHRLEFEAGQSVSLLLSPDGEQFVRVNQAVETDVTEMSLPKGWTRTVILLERDWVVDLFGTVRVYRLADGTSYQGPVWAGT